MSHRKFTCIVQLLWFVTFILSLFPVSIATACLILSLVLGAVAFVESFVLDFSIYSKLWCVLLILASLTKVLEILYFGDVSVVVGMIAMFILGVLAFRAVWWLAHYCRRDTEALLDS